MNISQYSFGNGLLQGAAFVESIINSKRANERADREEVRIEEDRRLAQAERERLLKRQKNADMAAAYSQLRATGKKFGDLADDQKTAYFNARKEEFGDDGTQVVGFKKNEDGSYTPLVTGKDRNGVVFSDPRPMTKQGVPVADGGEEIRFTDDEATQLVDNWGAQYDGSFTQRAEKDADRAYEKKTRDDELNAAGADWSVFQSAMARQGAPASQSSGSPSPSLPRGLGTREAPAEVRAAVERVAPKYAQLGITPEMVLRNIELESGFDPAAYNDKDGNGGSFGLSQVNGVHFGKGGLFEGQNPRPASIDEDIDRGLSVLADHVKRAGSLEEGWYGYKGASTPEGRAARKDHIAYILGGPVPGAAAQIASTNPEQVVAGQPAPAAQGPAAVAPIASTPESRRRAPPMDRGADVRTTNPLAAEATIGNPNPQARSAQMPTDPALYDPRGVAVERRGVRERWAGTKLADVQANPLKHVRRWNTDADSLKGTKTYADSAKAIAQASTARAAELKKVVAAGGPEAEKARRELNELATGLRNMQFSLSSAAGLPARVAPGPKAVEAAKDVQVPPAAPDYGKDKADVGALRRGSERNATSRRPELTQREIDAIGRLVARKMLTAEQATRFLQTGFLDKAEIEAIDPTKTVMRFFPDGSSEIVREGAPDPVKVHEELRKQAEALGKEEKAQHDENVKFAQSYFKDRFPKDPKTANEYYVAFLQHTLSNGGDWARYGLGTTKNGALNYGRMDVARFSYALDSFAKAMDEQRALDNSGWFSLGGDKTAAPPTSHLPREASPVIMEKLAQAKSYLKQQAALGNEEAGQLLAAGDEAIYERIKEHL